jgi:hypothetical protein
VSVVSNHEALGGNLTKLSEALGNNVIHRKHCSASQSSTAQATEPRQCDTTSQTRTYFHLSWTKISRTGAARLYIEKMLMRDSFTYGMFDAFFCKILVDPITPSDELLVSAVASPQLLPSPSQFTHKNNAHSYFAVREKA